ncbi:MAG: ChaN family lipoprotein [Saprospiraceae bacterium]|nr:ChaN family lipoprotein [Saprospiraceae bacterium]
MRHFLLLILVLFTAQPLLAQKDKPAYQLFTAKGKKTLYGKMMKTLSGKDIILFGEYHNNAIAHWLQLEVTRDLGANRQLVLGAEMFEADNQEPLDRYLAGEIDAKGLDTLARLWSNYKTDYAPLVNLAKERGWPFIATNIPRRFASGVAQEGWPALDSLSELEKTWVAPLPIPYDPELPGYKGMIEMMGGHGGETFPMAQASKDATMGHFILNGFQAGKPFIHYNGAYHSDNYEGILWYLQRERPDLRYATITTVTQADLSRLDKEHLNRADFILVVDEDMTPTY